MYSDREIIERLGGVNQMVKLLGKQEYSYQRVFNWKRRGIPSKVKMEYLNIFAPFLQSDSSAISNPK